MEDKLKSLKKEYLKTQTPDYLKNYGWLNLQSRLSDQKERVHLPLVNARRVILAFSILLIIFSIPLTFAQNSKPGQSLYQLKIASDKITAKVTGDYETNIEKRAQEVIEASDGQSFDEASKQYQQSIDEAKIQVEKGNEKKKEELRKKLQEQERKFEEAKKESEKSKKRLEEIRDKTRQIRGEVKGDNNKGKNDENKDDIQENEDREKSDRSDD